MRVLLDTHPLVWTILRSARLSALTRRTLLDEATDVFVSVVSLWEIAIKRRVGKLDIELHEVIAQLAPASKIELLGLELHHLAELDRLQFHAQHRDPFDHLLIAQAIAEGMTFLTGDSRAPLYPVRVMAP